ncbi:MAG: hypothetical protein P0116_09655 [Candidatus Nitrosocosmicus sp.]|nr:hypothetical protein [Candidatus Nitrosocosmicus sp.]
MEEVSGREMASFFDQWIYKQGHPKLEIEYSLETSNPIENANRNSQKLKIKILQKNIDIEKKL